jgi:glycosidase
VSLLVVPDCSVPAVAVWDVTAADGAVTVQAQLLASDAEEPLDPSSITAVTADGTALEVASADEATGEIVLSATGLARGKHTFRIEARDAAGTAAEPARAIAWIDPVAATFGDGVLYQVMIDRFRGDGGAALGAPATPGSRAGGTLGGVLWAIEAGYFDELGVSALWLSPVYVNPVEARLGRDGHAYEGYHGYWPLESRRVDERIGGDAALEAVVAAAHARGMAVLLDLVPNHVYEANPLYAARAPDGWFTPPGCVCGAADCPWNENIQNCWFTEYLPDLRWQAEGTLTYAAQEARFWLERFDVDGFRIDAVPMMPRATTRRIAYELSTTTDPRAATFLIGEVFTGPGEASLDNLAAFLGPATLDSAFDFPLMWALRGAVADGAGGFDEVDAILAAGDARFAGSGATIARMLGNHDVTRFVSEAAGDAGADPWGPSPAAQPAADEPYARLELGLAALMTLPGLPVLYYGDEIGLAGGSDPDSRRVMPAEAELSPRRLQVLDRARQLGRLRRCSGALRSASWATLHVEPRVWAYARGDAQSGEDAIVILHASTGPSDATVAGELLPPGAWVDALSGEAVATGSGQPVTVPPLSARVLLRQGDGCVQ